MTLPKGSKDPYLPSLLNILRSPKENIFDPQNPKEQKNRFLTFHKPWGCKKGLGIGEPIYFSIIVNKNQIKIILFYLFSTFLYI